MKIVTISELCNISHMLANNGYKEIEPYSIYYFKKTLEENKITIEDIYFTLNIKNDYEYEEYYIELKCYYNGTLITIITWGC